MKISKERKTEIKRMKASFNSLENLKTKKPDLLKCLLCKKDAGKNFTMIYKKIMN
ncbi:hypothetical protein J4440_02325 [Candidatus Woesearchaeota archaeon]|nr:hypothetical protein [Candidatus Woesearchaeota archaeon]